MGDLPTHRVISSMPFSVCGIDYAGPINILKYRGRGAKTTKGYIALFACFATKALHLELVSDLTSEAFIASLKRFCARRGEPKHIYCDNGTTFVGARRKLTEKPDVNSLWIAEQTSRSSLGQKKKGECQASQYKLYAANGTEIPTYDLKILTLDLGLRRSFQWPFIIAKVKRGIIGADFLQKFQLLIDLHNRKLIDGVTNLSIKGEVATIQENNDLSTVNRASKFPA
ncbi:retrovirus-related Pol polyprotein from transposon 17.6 [Trichonephila clavipes]|nr:retrovirus-related Pol polyprotein from transposon 17.6 [Trichonephila clavipes]